MSPPTSQPLARSSLDAGTTAGIIAWLAERNTISPVLTMNSTTYSSAMDAQPARIAVESTPIARTLIQSTTIISRRRSTRSTSTPPGSANKSQGSHATPNAADTISGLLVREATNKGVPIVASPLPRAEMALAAHSFPNCDPSPAPSPAPGPRPRARLLAPPRVPSVTSGANVSCARNVPVQGT